MNNQRILYLVTLSAIISACGSTNNYPKISEDPMLVPATVQKVPISYIEESIVRDEKWQAIILKDKLEKIKVFKNEKCTQWTKDDFSERKQFGSYIFKNAGAPCTTDSNLKIENSVSLDLNEIFFCPYVKLSEKYRLPELKDEWWDVPGEYVIFEAKLTPLYTSQKNEIQGFVFYPELSEYSQIGRTKYWSLKGDLMLRNELRTRLENITLATKMQIALTSEKREIENYQRFMRKEIQELINRGRSEAKSL